ncbi:MAG: hypothetical protein ACYDER_22550 [Ktedonobacteraceae bacterium]
MSSNDDTIVYAHLPGLLAVRPALVLHSSPGLLLCLICEHGEPHLLSIEQLIQEEVRACASLLLTYLAYTPYALVMASIENGAIEDTEYQLNTA